MCIHLLQSCKVSSNQVPYNFHHAIGPRASHRSSGVRASSCLSCLEHVTARLGGRVIYDSSFPEQVQEERAHRVEGVQKQVKL